MKATFYTTSSDKRSLNKNLSEVKTVDMNFKEPTDLLNPIIRVLGDNSLMRTNYVYIPYTNRYYFITDIVLSNGGIMEISLHHDILQNAKNDIGNISTVITRNEKLYDANFNDTSYPMSSKRFLQKVAIGQVGSGYNYYLTATGGAV